MIVHITDVFHSHAGLVEICIVSNQANRIFAFAGIRLTSETQVIIFTRFLDVQKKREL